MGFNARLMYVCKYMVYMPMLIAIEHDCGYGKSSMFERITTVFENNQELADECCEFIERIYSCGENLYDWDINLLEWVSEVRSLWTKEEYEQWENITSMGNSEEARAQLGSLIINKTKQVANLQIKYLVKYQKLYEEY